MGIAPAGLIKVHVYDVDDSFGLFHDGRGVKQIQGGNTGDYSFQLDVGESAELRFEIYNDTGGPWKSTIRITSQDGTKLYSVNPSGSTWPGQAHIVWSQDLVLRGR